MGRERLKREGKSAAEIRSIRARRKALEDDARQTAGTVYQAVMGAGDANTGIPPHLMGLITVLSANVALGLANRCDPDNPGEPPVELVRDCESAFGAMVNELMLGFGIEELEEFRRREAEGREEREREGQGGSSVPPSQVADHEEDSVDEKDEKKKKKPEDEQEPAPPAAESEDDDLDPELRLDERQRDVPEQA